jgi:anti-sigma B factor antagonist
MQEFTVELVPCSIDGVAVLRPVGSIDASAAPALEAHFNSVQEYGVSRIVVDFSKSDFISSAGIGIFLGSVAMLREKGGDLFFMNVPKQIVEIFDVINLNSFFVTIKDVEELRAGVKA